jgi:hypothetical protein
MKRRKLIQYLASGILLLGSCLAYGLRAEEASKGGVTQGIITARSEHWLEIKADGEKESVRYLPKWVKGTEGERGGLDQGMLGKLKGFVVLNRVEVKWEFFESQRILEISHIDNGAKSGSAKGRVTAKGEAWIEVTPLNGVPERYMPKWSKGLDKDMLEKIGQAKTGDTVTVDWTYDERKRVVGLVVE